MEVLLSMKKWGGAFASFVVYLVYPTFQKHIGNIGKRMETFV
jgi:hypothetical protein